MRTTRVNSAGGRTASGWKPVAGGGDHDGRRERRRVNERRSGRRGVDGRRVDNEAVAEEDDGAGVRRGGVIGVVGVQVFVQRGADGGDVQQQQQREAQRGDEAAEKRCVGVVEVKRHVRGGVGRDYAERVKRNEKSAKDQDPSAREGWFSRARSMATPLKEGDEEEEGEREGEENEGEGVGFGVVEFLHLVVEGDAGDARDAGNRAADHEDDAKFAEGVGEGERETGGDAAPSERKVEAKPDAVRAGAEGAAGVDEFGRDGAEGGLERLDGERERVDDGGEDEAGERERERRAGEGRPPAAGSVVGREGDEEVETDDGGRKNDGERDERFDGGREFPAAGVEPVGEREAEDAEEKRGDGGEAEREAERLPKRGGESEEGIGGVGQGGARVRLPGGRGKNAKVAKRAPDASGPRVFYGVGTL